MIQRIQTIWLLLAALTISFLLFIPMVTATVGNIDYYVIASGLYQKVENTSKQIEAAIPLLISTIFVALLSFINIFNYKNRATQKRIVMLNIVLIIGLSIYYSVFAKNIPAGITFENYGVGLIIPLFAIIFCSLAIKGINNDEKLIRSADRLR